MTEPPGGVPTIACAVDDSHRALPVARAGAWLGRELDAHVVLAHVFDPTAIAVPLTKELRLAGTPPQHLADAARETARAAFATAAHALTGLDHTTQFVEGQIVPSCWAWCASATRACSSRAGTSGRRLSAS